MLHDTCPIQHGLRRGCKRKNTSTAQTSVGIMTIPLPSLIKTLQSVASYGSKLQMNALPSGPAFSKAPNGVVPTTSATIISRELHCTISKMQQCTQCFRHNDCTLPYGLWMEPYPGLGKAHPIYSFLPARSRTPVWVKPLRRGQRMPAKNITRGRSRKNSATLTSLVLCRYPEQHVIQRGQSRETTTWH